jgi:uncharacterized protein
VPDGVALAIRLTPRGGRDAVDGIAGGALRVRVAAPPVDGAANLAVCRLVAKALGLAPRDVTLVAGATGRIKRLHLAGDPAALLPRLAALAGQSG